MYEAFSSAPTQEELYEDLYSLKSKRMHQLKEQYEPLGWPGDTYKQYEKLHWELLRCAPGDTDWIFHPEKYFNNK